MDSNEVIPLGLPDKSQYSKIININTGAAIHPDIIPYLDGLHHYDEICTALKCSPQELDEQLQATSHGSNHSFEPAMLKPIEHSTKQRLDTGGLYGNTSNHQFDAQQQSLPTHHPRRSHLDDELTLYNTNRTSDNNNSSSGNNNNNQWSVKFIYR